MTKAEKVFIRGLRKANFRKETSRFIVEGDKDIKELLNSKFKIDAFYCTESWQAEHHAVLNFKTIISKKRDLDQVSNLKNSDSPIAIVHIPQWKDDDLSKTEVGFNFFFERLQDPGNLGTILRTADWFGFKQIFLSRDSVDCFNPKVVSASKGAIFRIRVNYVDPIAFLEDELKASRRLLCSGASKETSANEAITANATIIFGNESKGISKGLQKLCSGPVSIPGTNNGESLNLSVSAGIIMRDCFKLIQEG